MLRVSDLVLLSFRRFIKDRDRSIIISLSAKTNEEVTHRGPRGESPACYRPAHYLAR
jgi:hypothetical protein